MKDYDIATGESFADLINDVREKMNKEHWYTKKRGWVPIGGVAVSKHGSYMQAMVYNTKEVLHI